MNFFAYRTNRTLAWMAAGAVVACALLSGCGEPTVKLTGGTSGACWDANAKRQNPFGADTESNCHDNGYAWTSPSDPVPTAPVTLPEPVVYTPPPPSSSDIAKEALDMTWQADSYEQRGLVCQAVHMYGKNYAAGVIRDSWGAGAPSVSLIAKWVDGKC